MVCIRYLLFSHKKTIKVGIKTDLCILKIRNFFNLLLAKPLWFSVKHKLIFRLIII